MKRKRKKGTNKKKQETKTGKEKNNEKNIRKNR